MKLCTRIAVILVFLFSAKLTMASDDIEEYLTSATRRQRIEFILSELDRCPAWTDVRSGESHLASAIVDIYGRFCLFKTDEIREAVQSYVSGMSGGMDVRLRRSAKLFLIPRIVFLVPADRPSGELLRYRGGWVTPDISGEGALLWPLVRESSGQLKLVGLSTSYFGPPYDALAEFDLFAASFERRSKWLTKHEADSSSR